MVSSESKEGVVIAVEEKPRALQTSDITQKIFQVDKHIGVAAAGYIPDARVQVDNARFFSQGNKMTYDEPVEVSNCCKTFGRSMSSIYTIFWSKTIWCCFDYCRC